MSTPTDLFIAGRGAGKTEWLVDWVAEQPAGGPRRMVLMADHARCDWAWRRLCEKYPLAVPILNKGQFTTVPTYIHSARKWAGRHVLAIDNLEDLFQNELCRVTMNNAELRIKHPDFDGAGGPHSRACGWRVHLHGPDCHPNCPTCGGKPQ